MAIIRQLKNFFTKQVIYPKTLTKAVYDENGERLDKILRDTMLATDSEEYNGVEPRDADTLGGKYKANDISVIENKLTDLNSGLSDVNSNLITVSDSDFSGLKIRILDVAITTNTQSTSFGGYSGLIDINSYIKDLEGRIVAVNAICVESIGVAAFASIQNFNIIRISAPRAHTFDFKIYVLYA